MCIVVESHLQLRRFRVSYQFHHGGVIPFHLRVLDPHGRELRLQRANFHLIRRVQHHLRVGRIVVSHERWLRLVEASAVGDGATLVDGLVDSRDSLSQLQLLPEQNLDDNAERKTLVLRSVHACRNGESLAVQNPAEFLLLQFRQTRVNLDPQGYNQHGHSIIRMENSSIAQVDPKAGLITKNRESRHH